MKTAAPHNEVVCGEGGGLQFFCGEEQKPRSLSVCHYLIQLLEKFEYWMVILWVYCNDRFQQKGQQKPMGNKNPNYIYNWSASCPLVQPPLGSAIWEHG